MTKRSTAAVRKAERVIEHDKKLPAVAAKKLPAPAPGTPEALIYAITEAAANPQVDIVKMRELYAMHKEMVATKAEGEFNDALAKTQARVQPIVARAVNEHTKSRYAKLEAIAKEIIPLYTAEGLSLSFDNVEPKEPKWIRIEAILSHRGGHSRKYHIELPPDDVGSQGAKNKTGVQAAGSTNSYGRRYLTLMIFNMTTFDDNDGNGEGKGLPEERVADHLAAIEAASDRPGVMKAFKEAYVKADDINDKASRKRFIDAKNAKLKALGFES